jgi:hypothetical protein
MADRVHRRWLAENPFTATMYGIPGYDDLVPDESEEAGLYADDRGLLGSISTSLMRAARLVVDTGMHAFGWSRERALEFLAEHVPHAARIPC